MKPKVIKIEGDKFTKPEPWQHRIEFPGGYISVDRTSDGEYWAHIGLNTDDRGEPALCLQTSMRGQMIDSRVDYDHPAYHRRIEAGVRAIGEVQDIEHVQHVAIRFAVKEVPDGA